MFSVRSIAALTICTVAHIASAQTTPSTTEILRGIAKAVNSYRASVSCGDQVVDAKSIAALSAYKTFDDRMDAKYAVLWTGDIGCAGGSGTSGSNIAIVTVGTGDSYMVDPLLSSPVVSFESPVRNIERIVGNTKDTLILEGKEYGPKDANCCPSLNVRFTLKSDEKGNWKLVDKKVAPARK